MRHRVSTQRLSKKQDLSKLMLRNLLTSLLLYERIRITKKRAQIISPLVDRVLRHARKRQPVQAIRAINRMVLSENASKKVMEVYKERYKDRHSGLTRMIPVGSRKGDGAQLVDLELIDAGAPSEQSKTSKPPASSATPSHKAPDSSSS